MKAILTYHSIDDSGSAVSVAPDAFRRHVRWLASGRVRVVTVPELLRLPHDADAVAITFDDGLASFGDVAAPLLAEHGLPATVFVVSDRAGATSAWQDAAAVRRGPRVPAFPLLDWPALRRLAEGGLVELGAHTRTHRDLTRLRGAMLADEIEGCAARITAETGHRPAAFAYPYGEVNAAALAEEVEGCAARIAAETGRRPAGFAYPYGAVDAEALALVERSYEWACTTELRPLAAADRPHLLPRLDAYYLQAQGALEAWGTGAFRRRLWLRARARRVRRTLAAALPGAA